MMPTNKLSADVECPACERVGSKVLQCYGVKDRSTVVRRRMCLDCGERWTTYESSAKPLSRREGETLTRILEGGRCGRY